VRHHALELRRAEQLHDAGGGAHGRLLGRAAEREGVRHARVRHGDLGLRQIGLHAQALDHRVQLRRLLRAHHPCAHGGEGQLVRGEQVQQGEAARDHGHEDAVGAGREKRDDEDDVDEAEQEHGHRHADLQAGVLAEGCGSRHGS
jgi:hypothetical protein